MKDENGFTLIEMLVVISIIGIILAIAVPNFISAGDKAKEKADIANQKLINAQMETFFLEEGRHPSAVDELVERGYLRSIPKCPRGGSYSIVQSSGSRRILCK